MISNEEIWQGIKHDPTSSYHNQRSDWSAIYRWINKKIYGSVLDIGCGMGHLAWDLSYNRKVTSVIGIDESPTAVLEASKRCRSGMFMVDDAFKVLGEWTDYDAVCFTQVLEHVQNDLELLDLIPSGKRVFISVPKEEAHEHPSHVHFFPCLADVVDRYRTKIDIRKAEVVGVLEFLCIFGYKL
jgi:2-polyprenyl-3-methyl-5-hydroxy-6-metoxy-1,4-benzoquinol methylase